jgi:D-sedoheptulose 7-phosphate isomerase
LSTTSTVSFVSGYLNEAKQILDALDSATIDRMAIALAGIRASRGRLFIIGVGGSAANASHAVNDFRKITGIEAYAPTDNASEITARINDEGWESVFQRWLEVSRLGPKDGILVFSVGGGNREKNVSPNIVSALEYGRSVGCHVFGIVGRDGGYTAQVAEPCVIIPTPNPAHTTPHAEEFQAVVWHLLVSHPALKQAETKWESVR